MFTFGSGGGGVPAPAPGNGGTSSTSTSGPAVSFGNSNAAVASASSSPPATGFPFGGTLSQPASAPVFGGVPAPATTAGFSFGGGGAAAAAAAAVSNTTGSSAPQPAPTPAPGTTGTAPPPATGFSFNNPSSSSGQSASTTSTTTTAPVSNFGTGGGFSLGGSSQTAAGTTPATAPSYITVPDFDATFPGLKLLRRICEQNEFESFTINALLQVKNLWHQHPANQTIRQTLHQQRIVYITSPADPSQKQEATLDDDLLQQLFTLADDLALTEEQALSLLARAKQQLKQSPESLYWTERKAHLKGLLFMFQKRLAIDENPTDSEKPLVKAINELLQKGLFKQLVDLVREHSRRLDQLIDQRRRHNSETPSLAADEAGRAHKSKVLTMHIDFAVQQRQMAAEILFFIAYTFHMETSSELIPLIQLVRQLSDGNENNLEVHSGLRPLNPHDVPSAYQHKHESSNPQSMWIEGWAPPSTRHQEEKNPFDWQRELVEQNWKRGHPQILRCVATLLMAATTALDQRQQLFDRVSGQQKAPTNEMTDQLLNETRSVLFGEQWQTPHILGILLASYAIVLQSTNNPAVSSPLSPRTGPASPFQFNSTGANDSSSDIRRSFRHALEAPANFKTFTFARLSLIPALKIPAPPSSDTGVRVSEFLLSVLTELTAQYFGLILHRNPPISRSKWEKDADEDLRLRRAEQEKYRAFQSSFGTRTRLEAIPAAVDLLQRPDCMDDVLALCFDVCRLGPDYAGSFWAQHDLSDVVAKIDRMQHDDESLFPGFCDMLSALAMDSPDVVHGLLSNGEAPLGSNTVRIQSRWTLIVDMIRYFVRELVDKGKASRRSSRASSASDRHATSYYYSSVDIYNANDDQADSSASSSPRVRELGEHNTLILSSHLRLVETVASRSEAARSFLRQLTLPIHGSIGKDSLWMILFTLTTTAISPELRGLVFETLASIVNGSSAEEIRQAWESVENCGILPIHQLLVYPVPISGEAPSIAFPPSSTARVNEKHCKSWIKADPSYALIYEMEYIEASRGVYPSTIGFLRLLRSLILSGGCPADLGGRWRGRGGCSPYIEYVIHLVLPRAAGTFAGLSSLPFRSSGHRDQLMSDGFGVISACLQKYIVPYDRDPSVEKSWRRTKTISESLFSLGSLVNRVVASPTEEEFKSYINDFVQTMPPESSNETVSANQLIMNPGMPKPKSPAFLVMSEMLSRTGSPLLDVIRKVLREALSPEDDVDKYVVSHALYGPVPPTIASAKAGNNYALKNLLLPLQTMDHMDADLATGFWVAKITNLLESMCAAACREKQFAEAVEIYKGSGAIIPITRFQTRPSAPAVSEAQISQMALVVNGAHDIVGFVDCLVGDDIGIARAASGFIFYLEGMNQNLPSPQALVRAFGRGIISLSDRTEGQNYETELFKVILDRSMLSLKSKGFAAVLGIPSHSEGLQSLAKVIQNQQFLLRSPQLASSCYEVMYRSMRFQTVAQFLGEQGFWKTHLSSVWKLLMGDTDGNALVLWPSVGWILCGLSEELNTIVSSAYMQMPTGEVIVHRPQNYDDIMKVLQEEKVLEEVIAAIPFGDANLSDSISSSIHLVVGACIHGSATFGNPFDTSTIVPLLLDRLGSSTFASTSRNLSLAAFLAVDTNVAAIEDNPLQYIQTLVGQVSRGGQGGIVTAATLANVLCRSDLPRDDMLIQSLLAATSVLLRVSCATTDTNQVPVHPTSEALIARACLKPLFLLLEENLVQKLLTDHGDYGRASTALSAWVGLLALLDGNMTSLLQLVTQFSFGSDLLLDYDILRAFDVIGERVAAHVISLEANNLRSGDITVPRHWHGHLELMTLLLLRASPGRQAEASNHVLRILAHRYEVVAERMFSAFPNDGDTVVAYVRCCAAARDLSSSRILALPPSMPAPKIPGLKSLSVLTLHVVENPLPRVFLSTIPATLNDRRLRSDIVSIAAEKSKSWWESLGSSDWSAEDPNIFIYGKLAMDVARAGLEIMREEGLTTKIDVTMIARAICTNVDALKMIVSVEQHSFSADPSAADEREGFKKILREVISELLRLAITTLKTRRETYRSTLESAPWEEIAKPMKVALDYTRLDAVGLSFHADENRRDYISSVAGLLRGLTLTREQ